MIYLDSNENLYNPYNNLKNEFLESLKNIELFRYPDNSYYGIRTAYANYIKLTKDNVIAGNGSDDMLGFIISTYIEKDNIVLTFDPDFSMYDYYVCKNQGILKKYRIDSDNFKVNDFIGYAKKIRPKLIIFSNPNNPTGMGIKCEGIKKILKELSTTRVVVDEAYMEFFCESVVGFVEEFENLIVTRTLSKAFSLASIRTGFLISNIEEIKKLLAQKVPFNVNTISCEIAKIALNNSYLMEESVQNIKQNRSVLFDFLKQYEKNKNIKFYESCANYIYACGKDAKFINYILLKSRIKIRVFSDERIRITVGDEEAVKNIMNILGEV